MTLIELLTYIGIAALIMSAIVIFIFKRSENWLYTFVQNFCGSLFVVSGIVKAVDPLGTAYKMEQYFAEFQSLFEGTWFGFLSGLFPVLGEYAVAFSVFMIVLEIVLGVMMILGYRRKLTMWLFLIIVLFFTFLTGFTYLTGHVPPDATFWQFGQWAEHDSNYMKVKDCGCFGDFIKLEPKTSFFKDVGLLIPAIFLLLFHSRGHQLWNSVTRTAVTLTTVAGMLLYCFSNYVWDLPHVDFRPFSEGTDIREVRKVEEEASANVRIKEIIATNKTTGEEKTISYEDYMGNGEWKNYPSEEWDLEQIKTKPSIEPTKVSEMAIDTREGEDIVPDLLADEGTTLMVIIPKLKPKKEGSETITVYDTTYVMDTLIDETGEEKIVQSIDEITSTQVTRPDNVYKQKWVDVFKEKVNPITDAAMKDGYKVMGVAGAAGYETLDDLKEKIDVDYPFYGADDILLKTMIRSNPGLFILKDGVVLKKWHYKKLPEPSEVMDLIKE